MTMQTPKNRTIVQYHKINGENLTFLGDQVWHILSQNYEICITTVS